MIAEKSTMFEVVPVLEQIKWQSREVNLTAESRYTKEAGRRKLQLYEVMPVQNLGFRLGAKVFISAAP
jgi:hypothetical protein